MSQALLKAAEAGDIAKLDELLKDGAELPYVYPTSGVTPLLVAAANGRNAMIDHLLQKPGVSLAERDNAGGTALLRAAAHGQNSTIDHLLQKPGVSLAEKDNDGCTALYCAVRHGKNATIKHLIQVKNCSLKEVKADHTVLSLAAFHRQQESIRLLLNLGAYIDLKAGDGKRFWEHDEVSVKQNPILLAAKKILDAAKNNTGDITKNDMDILNNGVNARSIEDGNTALHWAAIHRDLGLVKQLLEAGANIDMPNEANLTPYQMAMEQKSDPIKLAFYIVRVKQLSALKLDAKSIQEEVKGLDEVMQVNSHLNPDHAREIIDRSIKIIETLPSEDQRDYCFQLGSLLAGRESSIFVPEIAYTLLNDAIEANLKPDLSQKAHHLAFQLLMGGHVVLKLVSSEGLDSTEDGKQLIAVRAEPGAATRSKNSHNILAAIKHHLYAGPLADPMPLGNMVSDLLNDKGSVEGIPGIVGVDPGSIMVILKLMLSIQDKARDRQDKARARENALQAEVHELRQRLGMQSAAGAPLLTAFPLACQSGSSACSGSASALTSGTAERHCPEMVAMGNL